MAAVALLAGACGGDDGADPPDAGQTTAAPEDPADVFDRDACELLSDEQVAEVLGEGVTKESTPGEADHFQPAGCTWSGADPTIDFADPQPTGITVFLGDRQIFDNTRNLAEDGESFAELEDIGDEAYAGAGVGGVLVGENGATVTTIGTDANDPATQDLVVELLGQVAENV